MRKLLLTLIIGIMLLTTAFAGGIVYKNMVVDEKVATTLSNASVNSFMQSAIKCDGKICKMRVWKDGYFDSELTVPQYKNIRDEKNRSIILSVVEKTDKEIEDSFDTQIQDLLKRASKHIETAPSKAGEKVVGQDKEVTINGKGEVDGKV